MDVIKAMSYHDSQPFWLVHLVGYLHVFGTKSGL